SQECPDCGASVKKDLSLRIHECPECGSTKPRDIASGQVIVKRGLSAVGQMVDKIACGGEGTGAAMSSYYPLRQELLGAILGSQRSTLSGERLEMSQRR
ncbi:MAG: transposase, partial [Cyanobacteriota bacterium]|nr:transposase [Cyanobacteriota bacterium]